MDEVIGVASAIVKTTGPLAGAIFIVVRALNGIPMLDRSRWWRRFLPVLPLVLGIAASLLGGVTGSEDASTAELINLGLWAGALSSTFRKILGQTILADDPVLEAHRRARRNGKPQVRLGADHGAGDGPAGLDAWKADDHDGDRTARARESEEASKR